MTLVEAIKATYSVVGQEASDLQIAAVAQDLSDYPEEAVRTALARCRRELRRLTLADILDRLPFGHPGPEEAWAIVNQGMQDEGSTIIWTDEMREAFGIANKLSEDTVGARMAFKERYVQLVNEARSVKALPQWSVSLGSDKQHQELAILEGVKQGRLSEAYAEKLLPRAAITTDEATKLLNRHFPKLLE